MRAAAAPSGLPRAVLLGTAAARDGVRAALGSRPRPPVAEGEENGTRGDVVEGMLLIEPPAEISSTEATELATFLRGLQHAQGLLLAVDGSGEASSEALSLAAEFYVPEDWRAFLAVVLVGAPSGGPAAATGVVAQALQRFGVGAGSGAGGTLSSVNGIPDVFCVEQAGQVGSLLARLRSHKPVPCDPLRASSELMSQYRAIQQQLIKVQRPTYTGNSSSTQASHQHTEFATPEKSTVSAASAPEVKASKPRTVMVFGKTGAGKSHLANLLVGFRAFASGDSLASVTNEESVRKAVSRDGMVTVLDTIGFGDTRLPPEVVVRSLRDTALEAPAGIDALLFVLKKERVTAVEQEILSYVVQLLFGPSCLPNLYIVVTHAGRLAKDVEYRGPWLKEQIDASPNFAAMIAFLGADPVQRIAFVENSDPAEAEDEDDRALSKRRQQRALDDVHALLQRHSAPPYQHGIMQRAGELHKAHLEELKRDLRSRVESEVREQLSQDRSALNAERDRLRAEVEGDRQDLREREEELQRRFEEEWHRMRNEFETRATEMAREDLGPLAKEIVENTEKTAKSKGRRCVVM